MIVSILSRKCVCVSMLGQKNLQQKVINKTTLGDVGNNVSSLDLSDVQELITYLGFSDKVICAPQNFISAAPFSMSLCSEISNI